MFNRVISANFGELDRKLEAIGGVRFEEFRSVR
jgi:hypothetical protein